MAQAAVTMGLSIAVSWLIYALIEKRCAELRKQLGA